MDRLVEYLDLVNFRKVPRDYQERIFSGGQACWEESPLIQEGCELLVQRAAFQLYAEIRASLGIGVIADLARKIKRPPVMARSAAIPSPHLRSSG